MKERNIYYTVIMLASMAFFSCSDDETPVKHKKAKLNIEDASSLVVYNIKNNAGGRVATWESNIYKVTTDGSVEEVKFVTEDGEEVDSNEIGTYMQVTGVYPVDENYVVLSGNFSAWDSLGQAVYYYSLLVRKADGAIFDFGSPNINSYPLEYGEEIFRKDAQGNFYYLDLSQLIRINTTDPANISRTSYLPSGQSAYNYAVDKDGNCVYQHWTTTKTRIRKKNGGVYEFDEAGLQTCWVSQRGQLYYNSTDQESHARTINTINVNTNNEVVHEVVWRGGTEFNENPAVLNLKFPDYYMIKKSNSVVFINLPNGEGFEFFEDNNTVIEFELPSIMDGKLVCSDDYCYVAQNTNLYRISLTDYSYEDMLSTGQYEVYMMNVDENNVLQFSGLRFSDGKEIIAEIDDQNAFRVVEEERDQDVLYLQRLN